MEAKESRMKTIISLVNDRGKEGIVEAFGKILQEINVLEQKIAKLEEAKQVKK